MTEVAKALAEEADEAIGDGLDDAGLVARPGDADSPPSADLESVRPGPSLARAGRLRLTLRGEFALALLPTVTVLLVFGLIEVVSHQRLLFASLASSAFLIYLDPEHGTNRVRTLALSQLMAAVLGYLAYVTVPSAYLSGGAAMLATIIGMILLDAVHPPAVSTSLAFAFRSETAGSLAIFAAAVGVTAALVMLQRSAVWLLARQQRREGENRS